MEQSGITYLCTDKQNLYKRLTSKLFTNSKMKVSNIKIRKEEEK